MLVTGGCGFIGSHFIRCIRQERPEWRVVNLDNLTYAATLNNLRDVGEGIHYRFIRGDITDSILVESIFLEEKPWAVLNFAAESHVDRSILDPTPFLQTNVMGVQVMLDAARRHKIERFVQISTDEVYGDSEGRAPFDEEAPPRPSSPYAASKAAADLLCLAYGRTYGVPVLIARSTNNYGPFQFPEKLIPLMIHNALAGEVLPVYGDGAQVRDWLYVVDNCAAILEILARGHVGGIYNIGTGEYLANLGVVHATCRLVAKEIGVDPEVLLERIRSVPDRPGHDRRYAIDARKIREELGWSPRMRFEDGLRNTVCWYFEHQDWVRQVTSGEYKEYYEAVYLRTWNQGSQ